MTEDRPPARVTYTLTDEETGDAISYDRIMQAREEGEFRAAAFGLTVEGWRQERPNCWYLLPDRRFSIVVVPRSGN